MGYSITAATARKLDRNRHEGCLCAGPARSCVTRATVAVTQESWTYKIGEGPARVSDLLMCPRHAGQFPAGYQGVNFRVIAVRDAIPAMTR